MGQETHGSGAKQRHEAGAAGLDVGRAEGREAGALPEAAEGRPSRRRRASRRRPRRLAGSTRQPAKYLLLEVPNFNSAEDPAERMTSYLRLGTVPDPSVAGQPDAPPATGEDLAAYATSFIDDERMRDGCPDFVPVEAREAETAILHTKGGWRDHSDGNRITTTRGDKVEVIRGNYKLVVLGRQDEPEGAAGWDVSGGHIEGLAAHSSIEWVQTHGGTWKTVETAHKGDTHVTQHGESRTRNYGEYLFSATGSEDEMRPVSTANEEGDEGPTFDPAHPRGRGRGILTHARGDAGDPAEHALESGGAGDPEDSGEGETDPLAWLASTNAKSPKVHAPNPHIWEQTWARSIESRTGSPRRRVPRIHSETWGEEISSTTDADAITDETHVRHSITSKTKVDGSITSRTVAGTVTDTTIAGAVTSTNIVGAMTNLNIGNNLQVSVGATENINVGAVLDLTIAAMLQVCISASLSVNVGPRMDYSLVEETSLSPKRVDLVAESTSVAGEQTIVAGVFKVTAAAIFLG